MQTHCVERDWLEDPALTEAEVLARFEALPDGDAIAFAAPLLRSYEDLTAPLQVSGTASVVFTGNTLAAWSDAQCRRSDG